jgi:hypothetical protein
MEALAVLIILSPVATTTRFRPKNDACQSQNTFVSSCGFTGIAVNNINTLVIVMETWRVLCEVGTKFYLLFR